MARKDIAMTAAEVAAFLAEPQVLQVGSIGSDGWPHLAPMWYVMYDGRVVFRSFTKSQKIVNLSRDPKVTVLAEAGHAYDELRGVMIRGTAELITEHEFVLKVYGDLTARYTMDPEATALTGPALEAAFGRFAAKNTAVVVHPAKVVSWDHRKLAGAY